MSLFFFLLRYSKEGFSFGERQRAGVNAAKPDLEFRTFMP
jgi:hypothetical protein